MSSTRAPTSKPITTAPATMSEVATPAMRQYAEQKQRVGDAILFFRMGDFYETFYEDAVLCSKVLGIALTSRSKSNNPIPLAGIPYHALENYLRKLVAAGYKVAISEQLEDPKQAKGVIRRDVVRIVTAGTLTSEALLNDREDNILAAICISGNDVGLALVELAGGRFEVIDVSRDSLLDELVRLRPAELLIPDERGGDTEQAARELGGICGVSATRRPTHEFSTYQARKSLLEHFQVASLAGFGLEDMNASLCAAGCVIQYLQETQKTTLGHITSLKRRVTGDYLQIDHSSFRALEIDRTLRSGSREGSLLHAIDRTVHPIGSRRLKSWLCMPLTCIDSIVARQDAVAYMVDDPTTRSLVRQRLKRMTDVERVAARVALGRATPRDLAGLSQTLSALPGMADELHNHPPAQLAEIAKDLKGLDEVAELLGRSIREDPPLSLREGDFIAPGFDEELDRLRAVAQDGQAWLAEYQKKEVQRTGLTSLKVGFNRVFGYYIEVPRSGSSKVPDHYVRRQTVKNAERYITDELKTYEAEVLTARERANQLEYRLFERVREQVAGKTEALLRAASAIGRLDCFTALAELAVQRRYIRPELIEDGPAGGGLAGGGPTLDIRDGRHPVLDQTLTDAFVPNDTVMSSEDARVLVITGPNMAGKSTYIRQVALLTMLAQMGSFVPARKFVCSIVDRLFARVGSSDEIMRGRSTFMVEMTEAANILHNATKASLVVIDELGRGTSTFDGLSLAWAITEHLANEVRCRSLIATHYHELTELETLLQGVVNFNVAVRECPSPDRPEESIVFLHRIVPGGASKSYGIHVARLAGIPPTVIQRSREVLEELQRGFARESRSPQLAARKTKEQAQLPLFREPGDDIIEALQALDPDQITPLEALSLLNKWKKRLTP